jgi:predicted dehydrogenase
MEPIHTALTSYGMSGLVFHGPLLQAHPGFTIHSVLERHRNDSRNRHPDALLVRHLDEILQDPRVELVVVNTPDHLHFEMASAALKSGKHVVVEKPLTQTVKQADELIGLAKENGVMLSVFQNRRWDGDFLTVRKIIEEGKLGRLVSFESHFDRFRNYIQDSWKESDALNSGTLYNLGSHMIDQALVLFGMPDAVFADVRGMRTGSLVDDTFDVVLHYPDVKCMVRGSYLVKEEGPRYILHGTHGSFLKWGIDPQEEALKRGEVPGGSDWGREASVNWGTLVTEASGQEERMRIETAAGNYTAYYDNIHAVIRNGAELAVKATEARNVIKVIAAAYESSRDQKVIRL